MQGYERFDNPLTPIDEIDVPEPIIAADRRGGEINTERAIDPVQITNRRSTGTTIVANPNSNVVKFVQYDSRVEVERRRMRFLKSWQFLRVSAAIGLLLSCSLILFEAFVDFLVARDEIGGDGDNFGVCGVGAGIWTGALGGVAAIVGIGSFRTLEAKRSWLMAHFVLTIVAAVADGITIVLTAFCLDALPYLGATHEWDAEALQYRVVTPKSTTSATPQLIPLDQLLYAVGALLLILATIHMLLSIVCSSLMCRTYWCNQDKSTEAIIHWRSNPNEPTRVSAAAAGASNIACDA